MKLIRLLTILAVLSLITYSRSACAQEQTPKNFYYPTGSNDFRISTRWLATACDGSGEYITIDGDQKYHVGIDIVPDNRDQVVGSPVYAISDGLVVYRDDKPTSGWGDGNIALVIKHELSNGQTFFAVYGNIRSDLNEGEFVDASQSFATIGPLFDEKGTPVPHLHFGINLGLVNQLTGKPDEPRTNLGIMSCSNWPDTNGFVDPITWLEEQKPLLTVHSIVHQAKQEIVKREEKPGTYNATRKTPTKPSVYYSSVVFSLLDCTKGWGDTVRIVRGDVSLSIDLSNDTIAKQILEDALLFALEECPTKKAGNARKCVIRLYQLDEKYPQLKDDVVVWAYNSADFETLQTRFTWEKYENYTAIIANKKLAITKKEQDKEEADKPFNEFALKNGIKAWVSMDDLCNNTFAYKGKIIGVSAYFFKMNSATSGVFTGGAGSLVPSIIVSNIPKRISKKLFTTSGIHIFLAGKVKRDIIKSMLPRGIIISVLPGMPSQVPHLKFIDYILPDKSKEYNN